MSSLQMKDERRDMQWSIWSVKSKGRRPGIGLAFLETQEMFFDGGDNKTCTIEILTDQEVLFQRWEDEPRDISVR